MIKNRYFIIDLPCDNCVWEVCLGNKETTRKNNDMTKAVIKLPIGSDAEVEGVEYTHEEILTELAKAEWNNEMI